MDIISIMLARSMTPQGQTDTYVAKANKAAAKAEQAKTDAESAIATVEAAANEIAATKSDADDLLAAAQEALQTAQEAQINQMELYDTTGQNTDGTMTQKAITDELATKADVSALEDKVSTAAMNSALAGKANTADLAVKADKTYVDEAIAAIPQSSGSGGSLPSFDSDAEGHIIVIGPNGNIIAGDTTEDAIIEALLRSGIFQAKDAVGLDINYQDKAFIRTQEAASLTVGPDFDKFLMYGGRVRCNVADDGTINAFYGEESYKDDGSNGQVMVYQPKFYYQRLPLKTENAVKGQIIRRESIILSATKQAGLKVHPLFETSTGDELDYVLLPAYEGSIQGTKLSSVAGVQPASNMTIAEAENYATLRGTGWHIMNMQALSANQMLAVVEFGSMNGQESLESGISNLNYTNNINCSAIIGSTAELGNATGHATLTISNNNGTEIENTEAGKRAISYRGMENPWGDMWQMIGGINIKGDGKSQGGAPYICKTFNYTPNTIDDNYEYIGFNLPSIYGWISAMGYGDEKYDWILLPIECSSSANSLLPVGDNLWTVSGLSENKVIAVGGTYGFRENNGLFYYACDLGANDTAKHNFNARIMFIPTKNSIYTSNISKWTAYIGG